MTREEQLNIRLRLIDGCMDLIPQSDGRSSTRKFRRLLEVYREDTQRKLPNTVPKLADLQSLTLGSALVDGLMQTVAADRNEMAGWYFGCEPMNERQALFAVLFSIARELEQTMQMIQQNYVEAEH